MSSAQDPFYIVKEEIQGSIDKLLSTFNQWGRMPSDGVEQLRLSKELVTGCDSIEWQMNDEEGADTSSEQSYSSSYEDESSQGLGFFNSTTDFGV